MNELKQRIHDEANGLDYILAGDYYIPAIGLPEGVERPGEDGARETVPDPPEAEGRLAGAGEP